MRLRFVSVTSSSAHNVKSVAKNIAISDRNVLRDNHFSSFSVLSVGHKTLSLKPTQNVKTKIILKDTLVEAQRDT